MINIKGVASSHVCRLPNWASGISSTRTAGVVWYYWRYHDITTDMCNLLLYIRNANTRVILIRQLPAAWTELKCMCFPDKSTLFLIHGHRLSLFNFSTNRGDAFLLPLLSVDVCKNTRSSMDEYTDKVTLDRDDSTHMSPVSLRGKILASRGVANFLEDRLLTRYVLLFPSV